MEDFTKHERKEIHRTERATAAVAAAKRATLRRAGVWTLVLAVVAVIVYGVITAASKQVPVGNGTLAREILATEHMRGNPSAAITLVEYADFQCPACAAYHPIVKEVESKFSDSVRIVFRHFPLTTIHRNAMAASRAAEAAGVQGKFWEMHDMLYERQDAWEKLPTPQDTFVSYATSLGLNGDQFKQDINSSEVQSVVSADIDSGNRSGVNATPTFFLNGKVMSPTPQSYDAFRAALVAAGATENK